jgi:hypothetical protein
MFAQKLWNKISGWRNQQNNAVMPTTHSETGIAAIKKEKAAKIHNLSPAETKKFWQKRWEELRKTQTLLALQKGYGNWPIEIIQERAREIVAIHSWKFTREQLEEFMVSWIVPPDAQNILQKRYQAFLRTLPDEMFATAENLKTFFRNYNDTKISLIKPRLIKVLSPLIPKMCEKELDEIWGAIPHKCQEPLWPLKRKQEQRFFMEKISYETNVKTLEDWHKHYPDARSDIKERYHRLMHSASPETARWRANEKDCPDGLQEIALAAYLKKMRATHANYSLEWLCDKAWKCPDTAQKEIMGILKARIKKTGNTKQISRLLYKFFNCEQQEITDLLRARYAEIINPLIPRMPAQEIMKHYFLKNLLPAWFCENLLEKFRIIVDALKTPEDLENLGIHYCCDLAEIAINKYKQFLKPLNTAKEMEERYQKAPKGLQTIILKFI